MEDHPFHDGNKRIGWVAMRTFPLANCRTLAAAEDEEFAPIVA